MAMGGVVVHALTPCGPAAQAGHVGFGAGLIQEDQAMDGGPGQGVFPIGSGPPYVFAILFTGPECLFLYVRPSSAKA